MVEHKLRFDVETISKATFLPDSQHRAQLRFDVETISKATHARNNGCVQPLRFDVETISKATVCFIFASSICCGLM